MSTYSLTTKLPSCKVTRAALEQLEDYIKKKFTDVSQNSGELASQKWEYELTIKGSSKGASGTEALTSISEFDGPFPNDTEAIEVECSFERGERLEVGLKFNRSKPFSNLNIRYMGNSSREFVSGFSWELMHRLEPYRNNHGILH